MRSVRQIVFALVVVLGFSAGVGAVPIVLNPSFETDDATVTHPPNNPWNAITNWTQDPAGGFGPNGYATGLARANLWAATDNGVIPDGLQVAFMNPHPAIGGPWSLTQNVSGFVPGVGYELRYRENARQATATPFLEVLIGGVTVVANHAITPVGGSNPYHSVSAFFTATATTMELRFRTSSVGNADAVAVIDAVQIVPEPGTASLLLLASSALVLRRRPAPTVRQ